MSPSPVISHEDVIEDRVESRHEKVRQAHVGYERIRDRPHTPMSWKYIVFNSNKYPYIMRVQWPELLSRTGIDFFSE